MTLMALGYYSLAILVCAINGHGELVGICSAIIAGALIVKDGK